MLLYHGTSLTAARQIVEQGAIRPRGEGKGNFEHSLGSHPGAVYLTDVYALYFAANAARKTKEGLVVLEVDIDRLDPDDMNADEDVIEQAHRGRDGLPAHYSLIERTMHYRDLLTHNQYDYRQSLGAMGTCAHMGEIPISAITRACVIDPVAQARTIFAAIQPTITIENYRFASRSYRAITKWLFDIPLGDDEYPMRFPGNGTDFFEFEYPPSSTRDGIVVGPPGEVLVEPEGSTRSMEGDVGVKLREKTA